MKEQGEHASNSMLFDIDLISESGLKINESRPGAWLDITGADFKVTGNFSVVGSLKSDNKDILFEALVKLEYSTLCSRCLCSFESDMNASIKTVFSLEKENIDNDYDETEDEDIDVSAYFGKHVDILPTVRDHVALVIPMKPLCSSKCKGLCPKCGIDLNISQCGCDRSEVDPRFEALKKLLPGG